MKYSKYHAIGNDYLVITPEELNVNSTSYTTRLLCHRNYGVGADGILLGPFTSKSCDFKLRIFNPDGSEAEKSGNGLRIFSRYLWDEGLVTKKPFTIETLGGNVSCKLSHDGREVTVAMGKVIFGKVNETITIQNETITFCAVSVGNPHCVILSDAPTAKQAQHYGPLIEMNTHFPNHTNVQFMHVVNRNTIQIEIWERGAGYTLASGSSSTAAAAVARKLGLCSKDIMVHMPGGKISIRLDDSFHARMKGPVTKVCDGVISNELFQIP